MLEPLAVQLDTAALNALATPQLTTEHDISLRDAYEIQRLSIEHRYQRGESLTGYKLGFTSLLMTSVLLLQADSILIWRDWQVICILK